MLFSQKRQNTFTIILPGRNFPMYMYTVRVGPLQVFAY